MERIANFNVVGQDNDALTNVQTSHQTLSTSQLPLAATSNLVSAGVSMSEPPLVTGIGDLAFTC